MKGQVPCREDHWTASESRSTEESFLNSEKMQKD